MLVGIALGWLPVVSYYLMGVYLSGYLLSEGGLSQGQALYIQTLGILVSLFFIPLSGWAVARWP